MPKVSVVIPVYNVERYLPECLDSIVSQILQDIEIVCVNDGSSDQSAKILADYAARDRRIVVISQPNRGPAAARNVGAAAATGDYLYFFDSDDYLDLDALEGLHARAVRDSLDVLNFDAVSFFETAELEAKHLNYSTYYLRSGEYPGVVSGPELVATMCDNREYRPSVLLQFIRMEYFRTAGLSFYEGIVHEDNLFTFLCSLQAERVAHVAKPYFHRRVRANSIMTTAKGAANFEGFFITYLEMLRFAMPKGYDERTSRAVAQLCAEMYHQALKVYCGLPADERKSLAPTDTTPEALLAFSLLTRHGNESLKSRATEAGLKANAVKLASEVKASNEKLQKIRSSRTFKLAQSFRRIARFGR